MIIRVATESDIGDIGRVRMSVKENRIPSLDSLRPGATERMLGGDGCGWVCEADGRIVAFAIPDLSGANLYALSVEPGDEARGIGRKLHDTMMDWFLARPVDRVWLSTDPSTRAERFYRRAGWRPTGITAKGEVRFEMSQAQWLDARAAG